MDGKTSGCYLIGSLESICDIARFGARFAKAVDFIRRGGLDELPVGRLEIDGDDIFVNVADADLVALEARRGELHEAYFDIHVPLGGDETIGFARRDPSIKMAFDAEKDVGFCDGLQFEWRTVRRGEFALVWPSTCVHVPACTPGAPHSIRKLVFKVRA